MRMALWAAPDRLQEISVHPAWQAGEGPAALPSLQYFVRMNSTAACFAEGVFPHWNLYRFPAALRQLQQQSQ
jgi:hypothetical protein